MIIHLTDAEQAALQCAIEMRLENLLEVREQTGDDEYDQTDADECSALVFMLADYDVDPDEVASMEHLVLAVDNLLDWPAEDLEALDIDAAALRTGAVKIGWTS